MATNQTLGSKIISSYETAVENHLSVEEPARYVQFKDRRLSGDMSLETMLNSSHGKFLTSWRGVPLMKDCFDLIITQQLLWDLKPQTVIELGAYKGGSALWTADIVKAYRFKSRIISVDINLSMLCPLARECPDVTYIEGDVNEIEKCLPEELLKTLPHPWFINEDVHVNVVGVLEYLDKFMESGDYLLVEDTNPIKPTYIGQGLVKELGYDPLGNEKLEQVKMFMKDRSDRYLVDQYYNDFFGYNVTHNSNGFLKRV
ncbi:PREDICTED: rhamnosyl O-methyltransferase-like [Acropora digitifera]|uniref:rhamnosyl O-methyltransferase-like n=1 Tax=Acropora digitifera TaxID=70779 RepID=UPI00077AA523|nr:PREDICTED: rhamnosyl O-methyltransferase-like [Acropora digitifera]